MLHTTLHNLRRNAAATSTLSLPLLPLLLSLATLAPPPSAAAPPTGFASEQVLGGFALVTSMAFLPDGRLLVAEKDGQLWLADPASGARQLYMVLDNLETGGERGLLDIIIDSDVRLGSDSNIVSPFVSLTSSCSFSSLSLSPPHPTPQV